MAGKAKAHPTGNGTLGQNETLFLRDLRDRVYRQRGTATMLSNL
jgi:hypothetical protein